MGMNSCSFREKNYLREAKGTAIKTVTYEKII